VGRGVGEREGEAKEEGSKAVDALRGAQGEGKTGRRGRQGDEEVGRGSAWRLHKWREGKGGNREQRTRWTCERMQPLYPFRAGLSTQGLLRWTPEKLRRQGRPGTPPASVQQRGLPLPPRSPLPPAPCARLPVSWPLPPAASSPGAARAPLGGRRAPAGGQGPAQGCVGGMAHGSHRTPEPMELLLDPMEVQFGRVGDRTMCCGASSSSRGLWGWDAAAQALRHPSGACSPSPPLTPLEKDDAVLLVFSQLSLCNTVGSDVTVSGQRVPPEVGLLPPGAPEPL